MNILKRTQGIDLKARGTSLHGNMKLQLTDDVTGKVVEEVQHRNFFTKALDSAFNGCPFGLDSKAKFNSSVGADGGTPSTFGSISKSLLGGIICFPESLGNSVDDYYPSFADNLPTAYASQAEYQITDTKQGNFDGVTSGRISNGYRFVYNWGSSVGNGKISSVALSNVNCYQYFSDMRQAFFPKFSSENRGQYGGYIGNLGMTDVGGYRGVVAISDKGILVLDNSDNAQRKTHFYEVKPYNIDIFSPCSDGVTSTTPSKWDCDLTQYGFTSSGVRYQACGEHIYAYWKERTGTWRTRIAKINIDTGEIEVFERTWNAPQMLHSAYNFAIKDGYLYAGATTSGIIYKCNLDNDTDVTDIQCPALANENLCAVDNSPFIYGHSFTFNGSFIQATTPNSNCTGENRIMYQNGVWIVTGRTLDGPVVMAQILAPYCATKANLDSPVTKTVDKQMVVTYTVTQE